ncbi:MAG TPA: CorA family divalent cation transporter, partial [Vicinamibacteria bacterium]
QEKEAPAGEEALPQVQGFSFNPTDRTARRFGLQDLDRELADAAVFSWIDIQAAEIQVLNDLLKRWDIDLVLTSHFDEPEILPRLVERPDCLAFHLYEVVDPEQHLDTSRTLEEIDFGRLVLVLGSDFVITFHRRPLAGVEVVKADCVDSFRLAGKTPGFIAFLLFQSCLYDYAHLNLANDNFLDVIEERLYRGRDQELAAGITVAGRNILTLKKLTASLHIVLMRLATKHSPFISADARASFQELQQNAQAVRAAVDSSRDMLDGILAAVQASASKRTAEVARVLTVLSGILLPLTLVTGIYGMNFEHMPELKWRHGYFVTLGVLALLGLALFLLFRGLGWVGTGRTRAGRSTPP